MKRLLLTTATVAAVALLHPAPSGAEGSDNFMQELFNQGVVVDLREPTYSDGEMYTEKGGVIEGPNIRIQGEKIRYIRKETEDELIFRVEAEGNLMLEYGCRTFIAERMEYDFLSGEGTLWSARSGYRRWFFGGAEVQLNQDGGYTIHDGFITTCENRDSEWQIRSKYISIDANGMVRAIGTQFRFIAIPLFWVPTFGTNLQRLTHTPFTYEVDWGGKLGPRLGVLYEAYTTPYCSALVRLDYRIQKGFGGGLQTHYEMDCEQLDTLSYYAHDSSAVDTDRNTRYMLKGRYHNDLSDCGTTIDLRYEKYSDEDMPTDYSEKNFEFKNAGRSDLVVRHQNCDEIVNFLTRLRLNSFQTIKEELPSVEYSRRPTEIGRTGIITDHRTRLGYLKFKYANSLLGVEDFSSLRLEFQQRFYRSFSHPYFRFTPEVSLIGIGYSDSPEDEGKLLGIAQFTGEAVTNFFRCCGESKHLIEPYVHYQYTMPPGEALDNRYIFDIHDGWDEMHLLRFGLRQGLYCREETSVRRALYADFYADALLDTLAVSQSIPRVYGHFIWSATPCLAFHFDGAWDLIRDRFSNANTRVEWTANENFAISSEIRYRDPYFWRKLDRQNQMLESVRSESELITSSLSDRRYTYLLRFFYRFRPMWSVEGQMRYGWGRSDDPDYLEYQIGMDTTLRAGWRIRCSYQHKEHDDRVSIFVGLARKASSCQKCFPPVWQAW